MLFVFRTGKIEGEEVLIPSSSDEEEGEHESPRPQSPDLFGDHESEQGMYFFKG